MAVALVAVFLAVGGRSAYAATTNFLLNTTNTSTAQTTLNGSAIHGPALQLTNTSPNANATALALQVSSGNPPFTVNSTKKVAKLNADKLDGIDSKGFVQGSEHALANRVSETVPTDGTSVPMTILNVAGFGTLSVHCSYSSVVGINETYLAFTNASGQPLDVDRIETYFADPDFSPPNGVVEGLAEHVLADGGSDATDFSGVLSPGETSYSHVQFQIGAGTGASSHLATIIATATMAQGSTTCVASAQALTMP
jgi:hypothetical protein